MIAGTIPENETTRPTILSFDFARIPDCKSFSLHRKKNQTTETLFITVQLKISNLKLSNIKY